MAKIEYDNDKPLRKFRLSMSGGHAFNVLAHEETASDLHAALMGYEHEGFLFLDRQSRILDVVVKVGDIVATELIDTSTTKLSSIYNAKRQTKETKKSVTTGQVAKR